jgi:large subunit ribosomal protein L21|tara:strand:+ start:1265 stop:1618 length:354 start_codon:yes stop_codon:yes gene_type:complete
MNRLRALSRNLESKMFAVFQSGGKQHRVSEGDVVKLELLTAEPGEEVIFDKVLLVANGDDVNVGAPFVESGKVTGEVVRSDRAKKVKIIKFKRRKDFLRRQGHRQWFTEVKITGISA